MPLLELGKEIRDFSNTFFLKMEAYETNINILHLSMLLKWLEFALEMKYCNLKFFLKCLELAIKNHLKPHSFMIMNWRNNFLFSYFVKLVNKSRSYSLQEILFVECQRSCIIIKYINKLLNDDDKDS